MYVKRRSMESIREDTNEVHQHLLTEARCADQGNVLPLADVSRTRDSSPSHSSSDGVHIEGKEIEKSSLVPPPIPVTLTDCKHACESVRPMSHVEVDTVITRPMRAHGTSDWRVSDSFRVRKTSGSSMSEFGSGIIFTSKPVTGREMAHGTLLEMKNASFAFHGKDENRILNNVNLKIDVGM